MHDNIAVRAGGVKAVAFLLWLACTVAHAGTGVAYLAASPGDGPVTVFYPTDAHDQTVQRGPFSLQLAPDAAPRRANGRLVVLSHGSGANAWVHSDLARMLVAQGFVIAVPLHHGDNAQDLSARGPDSWKRRPAEVSRAIDAVGRDPRFAPLLSLDKVGMYGMSAGGHTALSLAGGRWSPARFRDHCEAHIEADFPACVGLTTRLNGNFLDGLKTSIAKALIRQRFDDATWQAHTDPRIAAIVAAVPFAADFDTDSLAVPAVPLGLVTAGQDRWLAPALHSGAVLEACLPRCEVVADVPAAGHGALLSPPPPPEQLGTVARDLIGDPPGFDRAQMAEVDRRIAAFLARRLLP